VPVFLFDRNHIAIAPHRVQGILEKGPVLAGSQDGIQFVLDSPLQGADLASDLSQLVARFVFDRAVIINRLFNGEFSSSQHHQPGCPSLQRLNGIRQISEKRLHQARCP